MSWGGLLVNLVVSAVVVAVLMLATFGYAMRTGRDTGLWRYTRHPNYFGDSVVWFGLWLLACSHWAGVLTVVAPAFMTNMLVRHTGKKLLEKHMTRSRGAAYADYVRLTSGFVPWPPPQFLRAATIMIAKTFRSSPSWGKKSS